MAPQPGSGASQSSDQPQHRDVPDPSHLDLLHPHHSAPTEHLPKAGSARDTDRPPPSSSAERFGGAQDAAPGPAPQL